jgi:hypothetical protein
VKKTFASIGDTVRPLKRGDFITGEIFEIELPDTYWIIADNNDDKLICLFRGEFEII